MERHVVIRNIERAEPTAIAALGAAGVATVHEALGRIGLLGPEISPIQGGVRLAGSAVTVKSHPGDNLMIHAAVEVLQPGDILVVGLTAPSSHGMFGDLLATSLQRHGATALVIDSGIRDSAEIREMGFPVWSKAIHSEGTVKATPGSVNVPIVCAGQVVNPGDVVVADDDGVCVVPRAHAASAAAASAARLDNEEATRARLAAGERGVDIYGLDEKLADLGVEYLDSGADL